MKDTFETNSPFWSLFGTKHCCFFWSWIYLCALLAARLLSYLHSDTWLTSFRCRHRKADVLVLCDWSVCWCSDRPHPPHITSILVVFVLYYSASTHYLPPSRSLKMKRMLFCHWFILLTPTRPSSNHWLHLNTLLRSLMNNEGMLEHVVYSSM